jgi:hypothetical protein
MTRSFSVGGARRAAAVASVAVGLAMAALLGPSRFVAESPASGPPLTTIAGSPFPSDVFTVPDPTQRTGLRIHLPKPDCDARPSHCEDVDILNELDGFNIQPRISVPFSGPIDLSTVSSSTIFLVSPGGEVVGINQVVWEPATNTLHAESDEQLAQSTTYLLVLTRGIRGEDGEPLDATTFRRDLNYGQTKDPALKAYRKALLDALPLAQAGGATPSDIAGASLFTTMSVTPILERIRGQIRAAPAPAPADFVLGANGTVRTVFPRSAITAMSISDQVTTTPTFAPFAPRLALLRPGTVGTLAFGSYRSPVYLNAQRFIPQVPTGDGTPAVLGQDQVFFNLFLPAATPARPRPDAGWPVVIYVGGSGADENKNGTPFNVAATLAERGFATLAINAAGQGRGPLGTFTVTAGGVQVRFPSGGRSVDLNATR